MIGYIIIIILGVAFFFYLKNLNEKNKQKLLEKYEEIKSENKSLKENIPKIKDEKV